MIIVYVYRSSTPGTLAAQEKMRVDGDEMGWQWMEQFLYWTKANSKTGSVGADTAGAPPRSPSASRKSGRGIGGEAESARGKEVGWVLGGSLVLHVFAFLFVSNES